MYTTATFRIGSVDTNGTCSVSPRTEDRFRTRLLQQDTPLTPLDDPGVDVSFANRAVMAKRSCGAIDPTGEIERICVVTFDYPMTKSAAKFAVTEASREILNKVPEIQVARHLFTGSPERHAA